MKCILKMFLTITPSMAMTLAVDMSMFTLAVVTLAVRTLHNTSSAYPMAGVAIPSTNSTREQED